LEITNKFRTLDIKRKTRSGPAPAPPHLCVTAQPTTSPPGDGTTWCEAAGAHYTVTEGPPQWHPCLEVDSLHLSAGMSHHRQRRWEWSLADQRRAAVKSLLGEASTLFYSQSFHQPHQSKMFLHLANMTGMKGGARTQSPTTGHKALYWHSAKTKKPRSTLYRPSAPSFSPPGGGAAGVELEEASGARNDSQGYCSALRAEKRESRARRLMHCIA
jgi:hypothetical protein